MVPTPRTTVEDERVDVHMRRPVPGWVRLGLMVLVAGWIAVFEIAVVLNPYEDDGTPRRMETHRQMDLPECTFKALTKLPCPSCGMTTSFALLMRGDLWNSLRANFAGTALACFGLAFIPWAVLTGWRGRVAWIRSVDRVLFRLCLGFMVLMFTHWGIALVLVRFYPN